MLRRLRSREELESALQWVRAELEEAAKSPTYTKETLITNLRDRVSAALGEGPYRARPTRRPSLVKAKPRK